MTDIDSLRLRDEEFTIEEKLICCVWVHDRNLYGKSYDDIQRDFEARFHKKAPKHDLLIMWERNAFNTGSVNFEDNFNCSTTSSVIDNVVFSPQSDSASKSSKLSSHLSRVLRSPPSPTGSGHSSGHHRLSNESNGGRISSTITHHQHTKTYHNRNHSHTAGNKSNSHLYKTELCRQYYETGKCDYGEKCLFAHGHNELKRVPNYKTKLCMSYHSTGYCQYGVKCIFIHQKRELIEQNSDSYPSKARLTLSSPTSNHFRSPRVLRP